MALATRCPHCLTTFRVANDQLKIRGGLVRCGSCREVFDGSAHLVDLPALPSDTDAAHDASGAKAKADKPTETPVDDPITEPRPQPQRPAKRHDQTSAPLAKSEVHASPEAADALLSLAPDSKFRAAQPGTAALSTSTATVPSETAVPTPTPTPAAPPRWAPAAAATATTTAAMTTQPAASTPAVPAAVKASADTPREPTLDDMPLMPARSISAHAFDLNLGAVSPSDKSKQETHDVEPVFLEQFSIESSQPSGEHRGPDLLAPQGDWPTIEAVAPEAVEAPDTDNEKKAAPAAKPADKVADINSPSVQIWSSEDEEVYIPEPVHSDPDNLETLNLAAEEERLLAAERQLNPPTLIHVAGGEPAPAAEDPAEQDEFNPDFFAKADAAEPEFVIKARIKEGRQERWRGISIIGSIVLSLLFCIQGLYFARDQLAARYPDLKSKLVMFCVIAKCHVELPRKIEGIAVESNELRAVDPASGHFAMTLLLRNQTGTRQMWPNIELTLNDANDQVVARRVFGPEQYLPVGISSDEGFTMGAEQPVRIDFELTKGRAAGYRVAVFYP